MNIVIITTYLILFVISTNAQNQDWNYILQNRDPPTATIIRGDPMLLTKSDNETICHFNECESRYCFICSLKKIIPTINCENHKKIAESEECKNYTNIICLNTYCI